MNEREICNSLKLARENAFFTQREVEEKLDLRNLTIRDYETGRLKIPLVIALKLANLYRVSLNDLCDYEKTKKEKTQFKKMIGLESLFHFSKDNYLLLDPIINAKVEHFEDEAFKRSIFDLILDKLPQKDKDKTIIEFAKFLCSLAGIDGKISSEELVFVKGLLHTFELKKNYKEVSNFLGEKYLPEKSLNSFDDIALKHLLVWCLCIFAESDERFNAKEKKYIEEVASLLKVSTRNLKFIFNHFNMENS